MKYPLFSKVNVIFAYFYAINSYFTPSLLLLTPPAIKCFLFLFYFLLKNKPHTPSLIFNFSLKLPFVFNIFFMAIHISLWNSNIRFSFASKSILVPPRPLVLITMLTLSSCYLTDQMIIFFCRFFILHKIDVPPPFFRVSRCFLCTITQTYFVVFSLFFIFSKKDRLVPHFMSSLRLGNKRRISSILAF